MHHIKEVVSEEIFAAFYGTWEFIAAFKRDRHLYLL